ncbi:DUF4307 domain-containing protein [Demequina lutea]|uniref:DUF4307 domain-containing protein n=1 Tax=Demequina lutea TaxID=431489 RepID=A0A7Y9ZCY8_9MICO|nr:DUF4307 domain-containing protein [Demequina lutea]NYI42303.1 hypothetical protein [Demequina lutea]
MTIDVSAEDEADSRPRLSARAWWAVSAGLAVLIALSSWWGWTVAHQPVRWQDVGFKIISPTQARVTYDVFLYSESPVTCHLRALNTRYDEVGVATQHIDPAAGKAQRLTVTLATTEEATTAVVHYCEASS